MTILPLKKVSKEKETDNRGNDSIIAPNSHLHHSHYNNLIHHNENRSLPTRSRSVLGSTPPHTFEDNSPSTSFELIPHNDFTNQYKRKIKKSPNRPNRKIKSLYQNHLITQNSKTKNLNNDDINEYNSGDEYEIGNAHIDPEKLKEMEKVFQKNLQDKKGYQIKQMNEDGACLFRAVADQVYGDQDMHTVVRKHCMDYMLKNSDYFSQFITENFEKYIARKCQENSHGNHLEIQAMAEMYNRPMEVYEYGIEPINIFHGYNESGNEPIRLSYHKNSHYNSVINPHKATIGVGLGMPSFHPGLADKNLVVDAVRASEKLALEETMLKDKLAATDWEATSKAIEDQVACESYVQWVKDMEKQNLVSTHQPKAKCPAMSHLDPNEDDKNGVGEGFDVNVQNKHNKGRLTPLDNFRTLREVDDLSAASTSSVSTISSSHGKESDVPVGQLNQHQSVALNEELNEKFGSIVVDGNAKGEVECGDVATSQTTTLIGTTMPSTSNRFSPSGSGSQFPYSDYIMNEEDTTAFLSELPPEAFGLSEWEDNKILAQVLAASQQEYLDQLKKAHKPT